MRIILSEDVEHLGAMGETVTVAAGYARNYLFPRKLAVSADSASAKQIEHELAIIRRKEEKRRAELTEVAKKLEGVTVNFSMRAGEEDKLFGSVTTSMIAEALAEQGHAVDRKQLVLEEPIKSLGIFTVSIKLGGGVEAAIKVWVNRLEVAPTEAAEAAE